MSPAPLPPGLAFTLYAPLAAMGDIAVGERRGGFDRPARSAILGLVAAALGYDRHDEEAHRGLDRGYRLAQRVRARGTLVEDYHTVQAPAADRKARWATRREALAAAKAARRLETLLSSREYRADPVIDVVLVRMEEAGPAPDVVADALARPAYTLSFGRKSCPLGLPPRPVRLTDAAALGPAFGALDQACPEPAAEILARVVPGEGPATLYADADLHPWLRPDYEPVRVERRRDRVASRRRWQFELRDEIVAEPRAAEPRAGEPRPAPAVTVP